MLVIRRLLAGTARDDRGAALVAVIVVMLVGVIVTGAIAGAVIFAMSSNVTNKSNTQAFVAAESGRDALLAKVIASPCALADSNADASVGPLYEASATTGPDAATQSAACPSATVSSVIVITSTGHAADGTSATVTSTYQRPVTYQNQPGGTLSYFSGQFLATQSNYRGDLVIREGNYSCNAMAVIEGDLWVPKGNVDLSAACTITGNVFAYGTITVGSANARVYGDLVARGNIVVSANNAEIGDTAADTGGNVYSDSSIELQAGTEIVGKYVVGGSATINGLVGNPNDSVAGCAITSPLPADCNSTTPGTTRTVPDLDAVYNMTTWVDLPDARASWGSDVQWIAGDCSGADMTNAVAAASSVAGTSRVGVDYAACTSAVTIRLSDSAALTRDTVFLVPPGTPMNVVVDSPTVTGAPQLFFIHLDNLLGNSVPNCGSGSASDGLTLEGAQPKLMFYTACGLQNSSQNGLVFNGQFYSNNDGSEHWVHPDFTCQPMTWATLIDLGCRISSAASEEEEVVITRQPPSLISQTEGTP